MTSRHTSSLAGALAVVLAAGASWAQEHAPDEHASAAEEATGHHAHTVPSINWTDFGCGTRAAGAEKPPPPFIASVLNFAVLAALIWMGVRRSINPALNDRRTTIASEIGEAQRLLSEAEALHREVSERLAHMDDEVAKMKADFVAAGEQEYARIIEEAKASAARMQRDAEFAIQQEVKQLRTDLLEEAATAAVKSAEGAVQKAMTATDQTRLADEYLDRIEKLPGASA